jgi:small RNA 2'-O-methyltransferase
VLFNKISPNFIILTTPNREFNIWFGDEFKIRDPDHKFEWNRDQFKSFYEKIPKEYKLKSVHGVGINQSEIFDFLKFGYATQIAIFERIKKKKINLKKKSNLKLFYEINFPFE